MIQSAIGASLMRITYASTVAFASIVAGGGCYKNLPFNNYFLRLPEGRTVGEVRVGGRAVVRMPELSVKIDAIATGGASMVLILVFAPGSGQYTFDPTKVVVRAANDTVLGPSWYIGPGRLRRLYRDDRACLPFTTGATRGQEWLGKSAADLPQLERQTEAARHLLLVDDTCFILQYDVQAGRDLLVGGSMRRLRQGGLGCDS